MKIVYISNSDIPSRTANSIHIMKMCSAFTELGHDVTLYANKSGTSEEAFKYYGTHRFEVLDNISLSRINGLGHLASFYNAVRARFVRPNLVITRDVTAAFFCLKLGLRVVLELHGPVADLGASTRKLFSGICRDTRHLLGVVVITDALRINISSYKELRPLLCVYPDAADYPNYLDGIGLQAPSLSKAVVGYTGHLYPGKGMEVVYELAKRCTDIEFHVVGGREDDLDLWRVKCQDLSNLVFHGYVEHVKVASYAKHFDVLLLPNQNIVLGNNGKDISAWTSPLKLFEYMSYKKPIIASRLPVLEEVLVHGRNSLLCDPENISEWESAIRHVLSDADRRQMISGNAYADFEKNYSWRARAAQMLDRWYSDL
jgi:glycosyltransferase involved in cell wall biosynthesis